MQEPYAGHDVVWAWHSLDGTEVQFLSLARRIEPRFISLQFLIRDLLSIW